MEKILSLTIVAIRLTAVWKAIIILNNSTDIYPIILSSFGREADILEQTLMVILPLFVYAVIFALAPLIAPTMNAGFHEGEPFWGKSALRAGIALVGLNTLMTGLLLTLVSLSFNDFRTAFFPPLLGIVLILSANPLTNILTKFDPKPVQSSA